MQRDKEIWRSRLTTPHHAKKQGTMDVTAHYTLHMQLSFSHILLMQRDKEQWRSRLTTPHHAKKQGTMQTHGSIYLTHATLRKKKKRSKLPLPCKGMRERSSTLVFCKLVFFLWRLKWAVLPSFSSFVCFFGPPFKEPRWFPFFFLSVPPSNHKWGWDSFMVKGMG